MYRHYLNSLKIFRNRPLSKIISEFIKSDLVCKRKTLVQLLLDENDTEFQYMAYLLYDTISNDDRALRVFEKSLAERYVDLDEDYTVYDMYSLIDIGFVYSMSTCAFELMQKKCKVVVYVPFEKELHPFYKFTPLLVSSSIEEFIDKSKKIMTMSDENYSLYIKDTLNYCLIDSVTNDLGCEFVSAIEAVS